MTKFNYFFIALFLFVVACGTAQGSIIGKRGTMRFTSNVEGATLFVNETKIGPIEMFEERGVLLHPGEHRVIVTKEGYFKSYKSVTIVKDEVLVLDIELKKIPD